jgi:hypothetical protein
MYQGHPPPKKRHNFKLNEEIKAMAARGGAEQLLDLVRREGREGGPEGLIFNYVNCCNWLNKYVAIRHPHS